LNRSFLISMIPKEYLSYGLIKRKISNILLISNVLFNDIFIDQ
jgi:hypothetical protein